MLDILEIQKTELLHEIVQEVVLLEPLGGGHILEMPIEHALQMFEPDNLLLEPVETVVLLEVGIQGPPGPPGKKGDPGPIGDAGGAFLVTERLGEIAGDRAAQEAAQQNLGLGATDPLAYYILAKA